MKKIKVSWNDFTKQVNILAKKIKTSKEKFDGIYGVPRGGLVLAVMLCHKLKLPLLQKPTKKSLVVDEISDTGKTLNKIKNKKIACVYSTNWTKTRPYFYCKLKNRKKEWLIFPWE